MQGWTPRLHLDWAAIKPGPVWSSIWQDSETYILPHISLIRLCEIKTDKTTFFFWCNTLIIQPSEHKYNIDVHLLIEKEYKASLVLVMCLGRLFLSGFIYLRPFKGWEDYFMGMESEHGSLHVLKGYPEFKFASI